MRSLWIGGLVALIGCANPAPLAETELDAIAWTELASDAAPPPLLTLSGPITARRGEVITLTAAMAPLLPAPRVAFVGSTAGPGRTCPPPLGGACLGLANARLLGTAPALGGQADLDVVVPLSAPDTLWFQAAVASPQGVVLTDLVEVQVAGGVLQAGDVCQTAPLACDQGLSCCYPCGIPGCQNVCTPTCPPGTPWCAGGCPLYP